MRLTRQAVFLGKAGVTAETRYRLP
jgi:hypothetical protein